MEIDLEDVTESSSSKKMLSKDKLIKMTDNFGITEQTGAFQNSVTDIISMCGMNYIIVTDLESRKTSIFKKDVSQKDINDKAKLKYNNGFGDAVISEDLSHLQKEMHYLHKILLKHEHEIDIKNSNQKIKKLVDEIEDEVNNADFDNLDYVKIVFQTSLENLKMQKQNAIDMTCK